MDFYEDLKTMTDEDIEKYLSYAISNLEKISKLNNNDNEVIGYDVSYNPTDYNILNTQPKEVFDVNSVNIYSGYVPKNTRVVYALSTDLKGNGIFSNEGRYYIVDDDSYIYEFCKYVREYSLNTEGDLFQCISLFLKEYLGGIMNRSRDQMFQMILKSNMLYCEPINEHKLSSFKHEGNAMCSEYAIMANNILSVFGFDSYVIMGDIKQDGGVGGHAFNFVSYLGENFERVNILLDFFNDINICDFSFKKIGSTPFCIELDDFDNKFINDFINNEKHLVADEYCIMSIGNTLFEVSFNRKRDYFVKSETIIDFTSSNYQKLKKTIKL